MASLNTSFTDAQDTVHARIAKRFLEIMAATIPSCKCNQDFVRFVAGSPSGLSPLPSVNLEDPTQYEGILENVTEEKVNELSTSIASVLAKYLDADGCFKNGNESVTWNICSEEDPVAGYEILPDLFQCLKDFFAGTTQSGCPPTHGLENAFIILENYGRIHLELFSYTNNEPFEDLYAGCATGRDEKYPFCGADLQSQNGFILLENASLELGGYKMLLLEPPNSSHTSLADMYRKAAERLEETVPPLDDMIEAWVKCNKNSMFYKTLFDGDIEDTNIPCDMDFETYLARMAEKEIRDKICKRIIETPHLVTLIDGIKQLKNMDINIECLQNAAILIPENHWEAFCKIYGKDPQGPVTLSEKDRADADKGTHAYKEIPNILAINDLASLSRDGGQVSIFDPKPKVRLSVSRTKGTHDFPTGLVDTQIPNCWAVREFDIQNLRISNMCLETVDGAPVKIYLAQKRRTLRDGRREVNPGDVIIVTHHWRYPEHPGFHVIPAAKVREFVHNLPATPTDDRTLNGPC